MSPRVGYIGSGNKTFTFSGKREIPFSKIKQVYGEELERISNAKKTGNLSFEKLSLKQKTKIRKKIKKELKKTRIKQLLLFVFSVFILFGIIYFLLIWFVLS